ncbi:MAG: NAD-dependent epimerase/dehydratase family protein [Deltaproteobacteria bacterium]|nr:NAD-dependent epimerase/dehydratase family protein [Deltaproteobacteria bacterium]
MTNSKSKVLVIGGDGLLGSHLVRKLIEQDYRVRVFIHPESNSPTLDDLPIERVKGDLLSPNGDVERAIKDCRFVFHLAAVTDLWASPDVTWKVNLEGTRKVLDACLSAKVQRLIFTGSASSFRFGTLARPGDEQGDFPGEYKGIAYMESKHQAMRLVQQYVAGRGLDAVIVAPTFLLGRLDWRPSSGELIRQFLTRKMIFTSPGGRNFAYAPDVADAMVSALTKGKIGQAYIAGGVNLSYLDFFSKVASIEGRVNPPRFVLPGKAILAAGAAASLYGKIFSQKPKLNLTTANLSLFGTYYSAAKSIRELEMPQTDIETAIEESIGSLREFGHIQ